MTFRFLGAVLVVLALCSMRPPSQAGQTYSDAEMERIIEHDLQRVHINDKRVEVTGGMVTLRGAVSSIGDKNEATDVVSKLTEVTRVNNELRIVWEGRDDEIAQEVRTRLNGYVHYTVYDWVQVSVRNGALQLTGRVTRPHKVQEIAVFLSKVPGVRALENDVRAVPFTSSDENLRVSVAVALYRALPDYATVPAAPLHSVVENAHVTLEGAVRTEDERRIAERAAQTVPGVSTVDNHLTVLPQ